MSGKKTSEPCLMHRRAFLKMGTGLGLGTVIFGWVNPAKAATLRAARVAPSMEPRGSARNCLVISLRGGPSHTDTFDLKAREWTPEFFDPQQLPNGALWPAGIMPGLAGRAQQFALLRSLAHREVVHDRAIYFTETGRGLDPGRRSLIPNIGAVVALERTINPISDDIFPRSMYFGFTPYTNNGFLDARYSLFPVADNNSGLPNLPATSKEKEQFYRRHEMLQEAISAHDPTTDTQRQPFPTFQAQAKRMIDDERTGPVFELNDEDRRRYWYGTEAYGNELGSALAVARNVFAADLGTHFIQVEDRYSWDHHNDIYDDREGVYALPRLCRRLDRALSALIDDLAKIPGKYGQTLLDESLIIVTGEFGRTTGALTEALGRDHYPYVFSCLLAGGGIRGGAVVGATNETGSRPGSSITDRGWSHPRTIHVTDVLTTAYSALGIDWTTVIKDGPLGEPFRYVDDRSETPYEIDTLF